MKTNSRWHDMINIKSYEVKMAGIFTILFIILLHNIDFYDNFKEYQELIIALFPQLISPSIGLLGFSLSGIAIIVSFFKKSEIDCIDRINGSGVIKFILSEYSFLSENIAIQCVVLFTMYFLVSSNITQASFCVFWCIVFLEIYHVLFIIFYTVALVRNIIKLYEIKNIYENVLDEKKGFWNEVNEVKIDFIISTLIQNYNCALEDVVKSMIDFVASSDMQNKEKVIQYIREQYKK